MNQTGRVVIRAFVMGAAMAAVAIGLVLYYSSPEQAARRRTRREAALEHERFIAAFDSLCTSRLYPTVWRAAAFTTTEFDADRKTWTLTISSRDWDRRSTGSRRDLAGRLLTTFSGVRAQAGGDPKEATLLIRREDGREVARSVPGQVPEIYE